MKLPEIKKAVNDGKTVHWANELYIVSKGHYASGEENWSIICTSNQHTIGLTWQDGKTMNGKESEFFIAQTT
jgi:hypothetical protein